jgi:hypothetical protein
MAKLDKEVLIKHRFWISLGLFALIWLVGIIVVQVTGDDKKKKDWEEAKKSVENVQKQGVKTKEWQKPWNAHGKQFSDQKDKIWKVAWDKQADIYEWPEGMPVVPLYPDDRFGPDPESDVINRSRFRTVLYPQEVSDLKARNIIFPADFAGSFDTVFPSQTWDGSNPPTREEIWLAQENFWVRREMLGIVKETLDSIRWFHEVKLDEKDKEKEKLPPGAQRRIFRNANFQLNLLLVKPDRGRGLIISDKSTIKNISVTKNTQPLATPGSNHGLPFQLRQGSSQFPLLIAGEPLAYEKEVELKRTYSTEPVDLEKPFAVAQVFVWENSPIRRVESLELSWHSHRTITSGLKVRDDLKNLDPDPKDDTPPASGGGASSGVMAGSGSGAPGGSAGAPGPGSAGVGAGIGKGGDGRGGSGETEDKTRINGISRNRYMHVTPQCRHLPIGMRLILDQAHIHDFLTSVANSPLRIQITQVSLVNMSKRVAPPTERGNDTESGSGPEGPGGPGSPLAGGPGAGGGAPRPPGGKGSGSMMGPPGGKGFSGSAPPAGMAGTGAPGGGSDSRGGGVRGRYGQSQRGYGGGGPAGAGVGGGIGLGGAGRPGGPGPGRPLGPGGAAGGGPDTANKSTAQDTASLVELTVYGIASLYERFPPKPAQKPGTPGASSGLPGSPK